MLPIGNGGKAWAQTIFYPFMYASGYGNGKVLRTVENCAHFHTDKRGDVSMLKSSVVYNEESGEVIVYAVNRNLEEAMELTVQLQGFENLQLKEHVELYSDDLKAVNDKENQRVAPRNVPLGEKILLKKHSWNMLRFG